MTAPTPVEPRKLALGTLAAVAIAAVVLVVAVLPAEYGLDPTGLGRALGFRALSASPAPPVVEPEDDATVPLYEMRAAWRLVELPLAQRDGYASREESEARIVVPLAIANLTSVTATLTWNDTDLVDGRPTAGDTLEVSIRGPDGLRSQLAQATNAPGQPGTTSASVSVAVVPYPNASAEGALTIPTAEDRRGVGNWTFVVRLYAAGGIDGSEERDPGQAWSLAVTGEAYELELETRTERLGDRVRLTLEPGRGVEYKFEMAPNATMSYRWSATAAVHAELHNDLAEDPEDVQTIRTIDAEGDEGSYAAPRHGRHGWYFRNDGAEPVTITLETRGEYRILGVV